MFISVPFTEAKECLGLCVESVKEWPIIITTRLAESRLYKICFRKDMHFPLSELYNMVQLYTKAIGFDFYKW
jgi:hypothetical protein